MTEDHRHCYQSPRAAMDPFQSRPMLFRYQRCLSDAPRRSSARCHVAISASGVVRGPTRGATTYGGAPFNRGPHHRHARVTRECGQQKTCENDINRSRRIFGPSEGWATQAEQCSRARMETFHPLPATLAVSLQPMPVIQRLSFR